MNSRDDDFITPIILASGSSGNAKTIQIMLHSQADILLSDREDCTALHIATKENNIDAVKVILNNWSTALFITLLRNRLERQAAF